MAALINVVSTEVTVVATCRKHPVINDRVSWIEWIVAVLLTVIIVWLMVVRWQVPGGIWRDEVACVQLALQPNASDILKNFEHEAFPPPFPFLVRGYISLFGSSDFALHTFGFISSILLLVSLWVAGLLIGHRPPLLSLALVGLNSSVLIWGSVVRGYGLAAATIPLFYACLYQARQKQTVRWYCLATCAAVLCVQWAIQNWLLVLAICVSAAVTSICLRDIRGAVTSLGIGAISALTVLPYLPQYLSADWRIIVKGTLSIEHYAYALFFNIGPPQTFVGSLWIGLILLSAMTAMFALTRVQKNHGAEKGALIFGLCVTFFSLLITLTFLCYMRYSARAWYFLPLLTILACNIEMLLAKSVPRRILQIGRPLLVTAMILILARPAWYLAQTRLTNLDVIAHILEERAHADDLIVACPWYYGISLRWYFHGATPTLSMPIMGDQPFHRYDLVAERMKSSDPLGDLKDEIQATLKAGRHVWIVGHLLPVPPDGPRVYAPAPDPVVKWSEDNYVGSWLEQMTWYLQRHSRRHLTIEVPVKEPVATTENLNLWRVDGWKP